MNKEKVYDLLLNFNQILQVSANANLSTIIIYYHVKKVILLILHISSSP